jgi:hypothetical protein
LTVTLQSFSQGASIGFFDDLSNLVMGTDVTMTVKVKNVDPPQEVKNREGKVARLCGWGCGRMWSCGVVGGQCGEND